MGNDNYSIVQDGKQAYEWGFIAQVTHDYHGADVLISRSAARANAKLIAAAPDLYEACRKALTCASLDSAVRSLIVDALAKADGQESA